MKAQAHQNTKGKSRIINLLYFISFCEGFTVLTLEIMSPSMISPYFGATLDVWTGMLVITLLALALGYYAGGYLSTKRYYRSLFPYIFLIAGVSVLFSGLTYKKIVMLLIDTNIIIGSVICLLYIISIPMLLLGMVSPLLIQLFTEIYGKAGKTSGTIFTISTIGSIGGGALCGYILLPSLGITTTIYITAITMFLCFLLSLLIMGISLRRILIITFVTGAGITMIISRKEKNPPGLLYRHNSVSGEVTVIDINYVPPSSNVYYPLRILAVNGVPQTLIYLTQSKDETPWYYVKWILYAVSTIEKNGKILFMGLGGGLLPKLLYKAGYNVEVVEISPEIHKCAISYFDFPHQIPVYYQDATIFIEKNEDRWNAIIIDIFVSEQPPWWFFTSTKLLRLKQLLTDNGILIINFYGFYHGNDGMATRALYSTLKQAGFYITVISTEPQNEFYANTLFVSSLRDFDIKTGDSSIIEKIKKGPVQFHILDTTSWYNPELVLTEDKPLLARLILKPAHKWRKGAKDFYLRNYLKLETTRQ